MLTLKKTGANSSATAPTQVAQTVLLAPRKNWSTAAASLAIFLILNLLAPFLEPQAYYANFRKGLNMPEKVGLFIAGKPHPDILFMGSSRPCLGFNSQVAQAALFQAKLPERIMNMSVVATTFDFNNVLLKNWILPNHPPKLIIYGVSEFDILGHDVGKNRFRSLWYGMPYTHTLTRFDDWREYIDAPDLSDQLEFVVDQILPVVRDRKLFRDALLILLHLSPIPVKKHPKDFIEGKTNEFSEKDMQIADTFYMQCLPCYDVTNPYLADIERFIQMASEHNIKLVFVNMPVSSRFRGYWKDGGVKIKQYHQWMVMIARQHNIPYVDYYDAPQSIFNPNTAFRDTNHLSPSGARIITEKVMKEQVIPLLRKADAQSKKAP